MNLKIIYRKLAKNSKIYEIRYNHQIGPKRQEFEIFILRSGGMLAHRYNGAHRTGRPKTEVNSIT